VAYFIPGVTAGSPPATAEATTLSLPAGSTTGQYGSFVPVSATLATAAGPVAGRTVTFSLGGSTRTATTGADGVASTSLPLTALPGSYPLTAAFDGDATLAASAAAPRSFTVTKQATALSLAAAGTEPGGVIAVLTAGGLPLRDKTVFVTAKDAAGGVLAVTPVPTDPSGRARLEATRLPAATATVSAQFAGSVAGVTLVDPTYQPSASGVLVAPSVVTSTLPAAVLNGPYSTGLTLAGTATVRLTATGLPPGISLVAGAAGYTLTGTPTRAGAYPILLTVDNGITVPRTTRLVLVVGYRLPNFLQPVNDPPGDNMSTFNVKSTVPVKFVLTDATGARIPDAEAAALAAGCQLRISAPQAGSTGEPVDEPVVVGPADSGVCFRYDATAQQFIYSASSANLGFKAGRTYNLTAVVRAPSGEVLAQRSVVIGFR
jgi:hypothetical protein